MRVLAVAGLAAVSFTCADRSIAGLGSKLAFLPIAPAWVQAPDGGPQIDVERVRGVLRTSGGTDSIVAEGLVEGDSAVLEFDRVTVTGDSTNYGLIIQAFDSNNVVVFTANDTVAVRPGENPPAAPEMRYSAPDTGVTSLDIQAFGASRTTVNLRWAGARAGSSCLNKKTPPSTTDTISVALSVIGRNAANVVVPNTRVGWTSTEPTAATVDDDGVVRALCSTKTTKIVAKTFRSTTDTITVNVTADPFTLRMEPEVVTLQRGQRDTLQAILVDENGNLSVATSDVDFFSSDPSKATVGQKTGIVTALRNGHVQITAAAAGRTTVGIVSVVRPQAQSVRVVPTSDTVTFGMARQFVARALDAAGNVIGDAVAFQWTSSKTAVATVNQTTGVVTANTQSVVDSTDLSATIDGKVGSGKLHVRSTLAPGTVAGVVRNAATNAPIVGAQVSVAGGTPVVTDAQGRFSLATVRQGDDVTISANGFESITFTDAPAFPNQTIYIDDIPLPPSGGGNGTIQGKVVNAINGAGVRDVTVNAYTGLNSGPSPLNPNPTPVATTTTDANGAFSFANRPPGALTFAALRDGYATGLGFGIVIGGTQPRTADNIILPPIAPSAGAVYVVLTWNQSGTNVPANLDLHITGPNSSDPNDLTRFQVHAGNPSRVVGTDTIATIDVARTTGPGPEIGSVRPSGPPGTYRFFVRNVGGVDNSKSLADSSGARVDVFQGNRVIATFAPPAGGAGTTWAVFEFDGAKIRPLGSMTNESAPTSAPMIRNAQPTTTTRPTLPRRR